MELVKSVKSRFGFEETLEKLRKACEERGWNVVNELDMRDAGVVIVEICKKELAGKVLGKKENCWVAAMMPCRFAVCDRDGVYVYSMNMEAFSSMIGGEVGEVLKEVAEEEKAILGCLV